MIETFGLTKRYGPVLALDHLSMQVHPGEVTGFLGPNGAGKSTTMRLICGLDHPTEGTALVNGKPYAAHRDPLHQVGALLDAKAMHPGRTARAELMAIAQTQGLGAKRVDEVLEYTGLASVAKRRLGTFSLGMGQRLGIAAALLCDPLTLILDEPINGLDPEGVIWVRDLVKYEASQGKTVFLSSHLMSEMALVADRLVILGRGKLVAEKTMKELIADASDIATRVRCAQATELTAELAGPGVRIDSLAPGLFEVHGRSAEQVATIALDHRWLVTELTPMQVSLEDAYMKLTQSQAQYTGTAVPTPGAQR
ncbi:MAG: ATP-binding cassette domain-containing protein [Propionibacteriaceae bacterium]|nr:ATP-binding cassette domain-containing protein [Propionibacteriaceae bacterium]